jgi:hypothetical protein
VFFEHRQPCSGVAYVPSSSVVIRRLSAYSRGPLMFSRISRHIRKRDILVFLIVAPLCIFVLRQIQPEFPIIANASRTGILAWLVIEALRFGQATIAQKYSVREELTAFVRKNLYSSNRLRQVQAVRTLGIVLGDRFGRLYWGSAGKAIVTCWQHWWELHHRGLIWDDQLKVYRVSDTLQSSNKVVAEQM